MTDQYVMARERTGDILQVLVIENVSGDAALIQEALSPFGDAYVTHVSTGEAGLAAASSVAMDLVLLDLDLPLTTGAAVLRELLARDPHLPVVILTANEDATLAREALRRGALDYIFKSELALHSFRDRIAMLLGDIALEKMKKRRRGDFLSLVAHDLLGPICNVIGLTDQLMTHRHGLPPTVAKACVGIDRNARLLESLVRGMLAFGCIQSRTRTPRLESADLRRLLEDWIDRNQYLTESKEVSIHRDYPVSGVVVNVDRDMLAQVMNNLLSNAIKFTPRGSSVTVGYLASSKEVEVQVTDRGPGIPVAERSRLFHRSPGISTRSTEQEPSNGLGLYIVSELVKANGGAVQMQSRPGEGTTMLFSLPLEVARQAA